MKNVKWHKQDEKELLMTGDQVLIDLKVNLVKDSICIIQNIEYTLRRKGMWQHNYFMFHQDKQLLKMVFNFWGNKGKVHFNDGTFIDCDLQTSGGLKIRFLNNEQEILSYKSIGKAKDRETVFHIGIAFVDAEKLLFLAAIGKYIFSIMYYECGDDVASNILLLTA